MADTSELEAELLAALGMPAPAPDKPTPTQGDTSHPQSHERHPPQHPSSDPPPPPPRLAPAVSLPPAPSAPSALTEAPAQAPAPAPAPTPTSTSTPTPIAAPTPAATTTAPTGAVSAPPTSALDACPASGSSAKVSNPTPVQLPAQAVGTPRTDAAPPQPALAAPAPAPQDTPGSRSPKRPRSPDGPDESSAKRQRMDQTVSKTANVAGTPSIDFAAMLNDALASFDQHVPPRDNDIIMQDADIAPPAAPASTTSDADKAENKIMKASSNPFYVMRSMSLPVLGNIAVQILLRLSQQPRAETESLLAESGSEFRRAYDMLRDIFRPTRKAFSDSPLLSADELDITDSEDRETIRMSNLAATAASVFGAHDVAAHDVHDAFFSIFIPEDGEYKASLTPLLVSLKTRLLLDALNKPDQSQPVSQLLDLLFPVHFDESLKQRSGDVLLHADEEDLVAKIRERREQLVKSAADESIKKSLEDQSSAMKFTESLSIFLQSHLGVVVDYAEKYGVNIPLNEDETATAGDPNSAQQDEHDALVALLQSQLHQTDGDLAQGKDILSNGTIPEQLGSAEDDGLDLRKLLEESLSNHIPELKELSTDSHPPAGLPDFDSTNLASFISEKLKDELEIPTHGLPNPAQVHPQFLAQMNQAHPAPYQPYTQGSTTTPPVGANGDALPPNQSMPTAALYEKARQAAVAKSSNTTRREGLHSTRRPWTPEEEKALMAGLDMVKGPHWSQILSLFGPQGTISDILKDRTQVQLKDKARNLKLFFLKTNSEMPYYLQSVTGELKTRAPGQAARKEAEEKARMNLEEEQARIQGIMTLAGGLQNNHHPASSAPHAASPPKRTSPATPGFGGPGAGATPTGGHMATGNGAAMPAVPIPPRIKTELPDQHALHKVTAFPPIQPAPAPGSAIQPARTPLPPLQPQPGLHQQPRPHAQQPQQPQRPQHPRQQEAQMTPVSLQQQQQQQRQPLPQQQPQVHQPSQPPTHQQSQPQQQPQPQQHQQPQQAPPTQARAQPQAVSRPPSAPQTQQPPRVSPPTSHTQPLPTPPIPPNHHSTPDHAQDTKLFETLQAAIAATTANESHPPIAAAVSEGSATLN